MPISGAATSPSRTVQAHPLVRLQRLAAGWLVTRVGDRVGHRVDTVVAAVIVRAAEPVSENSLVAALSRFGAERIKQTTDVLLSRGYLVLAGQSDIDELRVEIAEWSSAGWEAAAQYHFTTYGYDFETYDALGASREDARRMRGYAAEARDDDRAKSYAGSALEVHPLPAPTPAQAADFAASGPETQASLSLEMLEGLLSLLACPVERIPLPWPDAEPALRKTSPSGGSRHPTEVYVWTVGVAGMADGWWHVAAGECLLERIPGNDLPAGADGAGSGVDGAPRALLVYTSVFARNRYRYREPRTFRTVHMDVGHLMETCRLLASSRGLRSTAVHGIDATAISRALRLDPLGEFPIAATLLLEGCSA